LTKEFYEIFDEINGSEHTQESVALTEYCNTRTKKITKEQIIKARKAYLDTISSPEWATGLHKFLQLKKMQAIIKASKQEIKVDKAEEQKKKDKLKKAREAFENKNIFKEN
jgi:hypothetical protein